MRKKSPFPGMDHWLEDYWGDVHAILTTCASDRLQPGYPGLKARIEEYVTVESEFDTEDWRKHFVPDVIVTDTQPRLSTSETHSSLAVLLDTEPVLLPCPEVEPPTLRRIQIVDTKNGHRVIASIEFFSPANKIGRGLKKYFEKQQLMVEGGVHLVEIDLVRLGDWAVAIDIGCVPVKLRGLYRASARPRGASGSSRVLSNSTYRAATKNQDSTTPSRRRCHPRASTAAGRGVHQWRLLRRYRL